MTVLYSPSAAGFFLADLSPDIPADAVEITPARHRELLAAQEEGREIIANEDGRPALKRVLADDRRGALAQAVRAEARRRILAISPEWRQLNDLRAPSDEGTARFAAIDAVRAASNLLEVLVADLPAAELDGFDPRGRAEWPEGSI